MTIIKKKNEKMMKMGNRSETFNYFNHSAMNSLIRPHIIFMNREKELFFLFNFFFVENHHYSFFF